MIDNKTFEKFFYDEIIALTFDSACVKIKELGNGFELKKLDSNGNINIINDNVLYATFTSEGISFK